MDGDSVKDIGRSKLHNGIFNDIRELDIAGRSAIYIILTANVAEADIWFVPSVTT